MPSQTPSTSTDSGPKPGQDRPIRVLVVDDDKRVGRQITKGFKSGQLQVHQVANLSQANQYLNQQRVDLAIVEANLSDGSGLALAKQLGQDHPLTHTIVMTDQPSLDRALQAIRSGVVDLILKPLDPQEVKQRIDQAVVRLHDDQRKRQRIRRLRRICKKLNRARDEIAHQVDILCNDLVIAYQELAQQVNLLSQTSEFTGLIRQELDLETLLRRTLEYVLQKVGPTNAAIFLPGNTDPGEYSLGGYVNYECASESAEILLQHMADVLAPKVDESNWPVHITDNQMLTDWLGQEFAYLTDHHLLAFPCQHDEETLAIVALFRHHDRPFGGSAIQCCTSIAPMLAETLAKAVSIHHRLMSDLDDPDLAPE